MKNINHKMRNILRIENYLN